MKRIYLLAIALLVPMHASAIEQDSVYTWGKWSEGLKPAAGPVARVTPPPAKTPNVNFRPNENSAFLREAILTPNTIAGFSNIDASTPVISAPPTPVTLPPPPPAPFQ
ncbi:MAG: hypothetical protein DIZ80_10890 [endosymbiont of Galathealinum brachiosum]|uniref:Uncharacterized protein n=1 Tax=endosymbiont of Galathealinum brachiosum TaxID=2200906 RepID=A0A370DEG8_9GAMM|nr:MAG: hypothetical protein DIZ80_10890 [endosymbiont of Galathealinum brachiosum]